MKKVCKWRGDPRRRYQRDLPLLRRGVEVVRSPVASSQRRLHSRQVASLGEVLIRRDTFLRHKA
jgi:hypothetical protein